MLLEISAAHEEPNAIAESLACRCCQFQIGVKAPFNKSIELLTGNQETCGNLAFPFAPILEPLQRRAATLVTASDQ
jgi:hypothetical protein